MSKKRFLFIILVILTCTYFTVKYYGASWIEHLFVNQDFSTLNKIAHISTNQSLDYYLGVAQENLIGPLSSLISGLIFILISLAFLKNTSTIKFIGAVVLFLLVTKFEVLFFPPYGDHLGGPLGEAVWLARHNHDYIGLFHQKGSIYGGPKFYLFSIYPGFIAFWMRVLPNVTSFLIVNHLIVFILSAVIVGVFRQLLQKVFSSTIATLCALLLLSLPLYQSMSESINMEIPCLFFAMLCISNLTNKNIAKASIFAILSLLVKGMGAVACATVFVTCLTLFFFDSKLKYRFSMILWGTLALGMAVLRVYLRGKYVHDQPLSHNAVGIFVGWPNIVSNWLILRLLIFSIASTMLYYIYKLLKKPKADRQERFTPADLIIITMFLGMLFWFALQLNLIVTGPRYKLFLSPFIIFCVLFAISRFLSYKPILIGLLIISILGSYFCSYGAHYPARIPSRYYAYGVTERSLEYRNDLFLHMKLAKEFETNFPNFLIGAPFVTAHAMNFKEYGYVKKPLDVVMYGMHITYSDIQNFTGLKNIDFKRTIWIGFKGDYPKEFPYPIDPKDKVLKEVIVGDKKATLFMGGFAIDRLFKLVMMKNLKNLKK